MGRVMQVSQDSPTPEALDAATKVPEAGSHCVAHRFRLWVSCGDANNPLTAYI